MYRGGGGEVRVEMRGHMMKNFLFPFFIVMHIIVHTGVRSAYSGFCKCAIGKCGGHHH